ncbi:dTDP-4-dehydrorhamnose 3,5-epimerase [Fluviicola taffensis]|uniref:dTDP-4-dehydrorhamnose 3,5-epimerase n=1 Tax=Fluviicola taffensis (strain DSM 16823 / NCIMB 13979 / RW262) TaxID=755732 RepID=F2IKD5_FLUTR|nr:dTDP-4-dehydrorhamnose 3,5-epimerase [Fluviicola taffensis]AEA44038.1 dTDP-4-dehydrorhamnose 3,5-epimerase [Fluviicola taffensis DSM 16823]
MEFKRTAIVDVLLIQPTIFGDDRGYFFESFHQQKFNEFIGAEINFVQDNESKSAKGVLRGLHFQAPPHAQGKLVRVVQGSVLDVALDIRKNSPTYGQHVSFVLSAENKMQAYIPAGFAHGFVTLEKDTIFQYKCTNWYNPSSEGSILWNDPALTIQWQEMNPILSDKDKLGILLADFNSPFE